jgi:hypothetical protein
MKIAVKALKRIGRYRTGDEFALTRKDKRSKTTFPIPVKI